MELDSLTASNKQASNVIYPPPPWWEPSNSGGSVADALLFHSQCCMLGMFTDWVPIPTHMEYSDIQIFIQSYVNVNHKWGVIFFLSSCASCKLYILKYMKVANFSASMIMVRFLWNMQTSSPLIISCIKRMLSKLYADNIISNLSWQIEKFDPHEYHLWSFTIRWLCLITHTHTYTYTNIERGRDR